MPIGVNFPGMFTNQDGLCITPQKIDTLTGQQIARITRHITYRFI